MKKKKSHDSPPQNKTKKFHTPVHLGESARGCSDTAEREGRGDTRRRARRVKQPPQPCEKLRNSSDSKKYKVSRNVGSYFETGRSEAASTPQASTWCLSTATLVQHRRLSHNPFPSTIHLVPQHIG
jgi:hypothetical protein